MKKKIVSVLMLALLAVLATIASGLGEDDDLIPDYSSAPAVGSRYTSSFTGWSFESETLTLTADAPDYLGISVNDYIDNRPWKDIVEQIKYVVIEPNVKYVGAIAFEGCTNLLEVDIRGDLILIGNSAFKNCKSLQTFTAPETLVEFGTDVFVNCENLSEVIFEGNAEHIFGHETFSGCTSLKEISLPCGSAGVNMFLGCSSLEKVLFTNVDDAHGVSINNYAFMNCTSLKTISPNDIRHIGESAFENCTSLEEIIFGNEHINISSYAFKDDIALKKIRFQSIEPARIDPDTFENVTATVYYPGYQAWNDMSETSYGGTLQWVPYEVEDEIISGKLNNVNWSLSLKTGLLTISGYGDIDSIDYRTFEDWVSYEANVVKIVFENGITNVPARGFEGFRSLKEVILPESVVKFGQYAFSGCWKLKSVQLPAGMVTIEEGTFRNCSSLTEIEIPQTVRYIKPYAFMGCTSLKEVNIPDKVISIGEYAFKDCSSVTSINLGKGLEVIGDLAFALCRNVDYITIPASVKAIEGKSSLAGISNVRFLGDLPEFTYLGEKNNPFGTKWSVWTDNYSDGIYGTNFGVITCFYPKGNDTWSEIIQDTLEGEGGSVIWKAYDGKTDIADCIAWLDETAFMYDGTAKEPVIHVTDNNVELTENTDYEILYSDNVNAGRAMVTITGIGDYSGEIEVTYIIAKAFPVLTFAQSSVGAKVGDDSFFNELTSITDGTLQFTSSDETIASVNDDGFVTVKTVGTVQIQVNSSEGRNYYAGEAGFALTVSEIELPSITWSDLHYAFSNSFSDLGYKSGYKIPLKAYEVFFSDSQAKVLYANASAWQGSCFGFSSSTSLFNGASSGLSLSSFNASKVSSLKTSTSSSQLSMNVKELLEAMQVSWYTTYIGYQLKLNDLAGLIAEVERGSTQHTLPVICVYKGKSGHALVGYKIEKINNTTAFLYVYDCNYPNDNSRKITLAMDADGNYTGWSYSINDRINCGSSISGSSIAYIPYANLKAAWSSRRSGAPNVNILYTNTANFEIQDYAGNKIAEKKDGIFTSRSGSVYEYKNIVEQAFSGTVVCLPADVYQIVNHENRSDFTATMVNVDQTAEVHTDADKIIFAVVDKEETNTVSIDAQSQESYYVKLVSELSCATGAEVIEFSGTGDDATVVVGTIHGDISLTNCTGVTMLVNHQMVATTSEEYQRDLNALDIHLEYTQAVYTGEDIKPAVIIGENYELVEGIDYVVTYADNRNVGTATATAYGIGNYTGNVIMEFTIVETEDDLCPDGHEWHQSEITEEPTFIQNGKMIRVCSVCGKTEEVEIAGLSWKTSKSGNMTMIHLSNVTNDNLDGNMVIAGYDSDGSMAWADISHIQIEGGSEIKKSVSSSNATLIKVMILENDTFKPISLAYILE